MMQRLILMFLLAAASPSHAADQFDLRCQGEQQLGIKETPKPHIYGFRIDLKARKWCWSHCDIVFDIQEVQPDRLVLKREDLKTQMNSRYFYNEINRTNGQHDMESIMTRPAAVYYKIKGQCEPVAFSGFPATKF